jgi:hypothetical protein
MEHERGCSNGRIHDDDSSVSCRGDCSEGASCTCRTADHDLVVGGDDDDDGNGGDGGGGGHGGVGEGRGTCRMRVGDTSSSTAAASMTRSASKGTGVLTCASEGTSSPERGRERAFWNFRLSLRGAVPELTAILCAC